MKLSNMNIESSPQLPGIMEEEFSVLKESIVTDADKQSSKDHIESQEYVLSNPKNYEELKKKDAELAEIVKKLGYKVTDVRPCPADVFAQLSKNREKFTQMCASDSPPIWFSQEWVKEYPKFYYAQLENWFFLQRENGMGVMNLNIPPSKFHISTRPSYKVTLKCNLSNDTKFPIEEVDIYVHDISFFDAFDVVPTEQIDSVASMSFAESDNNYYIWDQKVDARVYFNYLVFKMENMKERRWWDAPRSKQWAKYSRISFRYFYANVWQADPSYTLSLEDAKNRSEDR